MELNAVMCGSYAIYRCIQQNIRRAQEAQVQATQLAMANGSVHMQVIGADANPEDANMDAIGEQTMVLQMQQLPMQNTFAKVRDVPGT